MCSNTLRIIHTLYSRDGTSNWIFIWLYWTESFYIWAWMFSLGQVESTVYREVSSAFANRLCHTPRWSNSVLFPLFLFCFFLFCFFERWCYFKPTAVTETIGLQSQSNSGFCGLLHVYCMFCSVMKDALLIATNLGIVWSRDLLLNTPYRKHTWKNVRRCECIHSI